MLAWPTRTADVQWDEGIQAPNGDEFTVSGYNLARSIAGALVFRGRYVVRVDKWPRRFWRRPPWQAAVSRDDAERLIGELRELIAAGQWAPGQGEPPVTYASD